MARDRTALSFIDCHELKVGVNVNAAKRHAGDGESWKGSAGGVRGQEKTKEEVNLVKSQ